MLRSFPKRLKNVSSHSAFFLLRASGSIPRLLFLRSSPTCKNRESLSYYDSVLRKTLESIHNSELSHAGRLQSSRPVKLGGIGILHAVEMSLFCFISSGETCYRSGYWFPYSSIPQPEDHARLHAIQQPGSSDWLTALPSPQLGTHMDDESMSVLLDP